MVYVGGEYDFDLSIDGDGDLRLHWVDDGVEHVVWLDTHDVLSALHELGALRRSARPEPSARVAEEWREHAKDDPAERAETAAARVAHATEWADKPPSWVRYYKDKDGDVWRTHPDGSCRVTLHRWRSGHLAQHTAWGDLDALEAWSGPLKDVTNEEVSRQLHKKRGGGADA